MSGAAATPSAAATTSARNSSVATRVDQRLVLLQVVLVLVLAQNRHERLREGALGEQAAQQVGNLEGDEEGVGQQARRRRSGR